MVYTKNELTEIAEIAIELGIFIITDELYEKILYDDHQHESIAGLHPQMKQHALVVNGLSKAYAMTGWRLGYIAGPKDVIDLVVKFRSAPPENGHLYSVCGAKTSTWYRKI